MTSSLIKWVRKSVFSQYLYYFNSFSLSSENYFESITKTKEDDLIVNKKGVNVSKKTNEVSLSQPPNIKVELRYGLSHSMPVEVAQSTVTATSSKYSDGFQQNLNFLLAERLAGQHEKIEDNEYEEVGIYTRDKISGNSYDAAVYGNMNAIRRNQEFTPEFHSLPSSNDDE